MLAWAVLTVLTLAGAPSASAKNAPADVLVTVDGVPLKRAEVADRAWKEYGSTALNEMVDELLIGQARRTLGVRPDPAEAEARLKRIRDQFSDEKTFRERLKSNGGGVEQLKAQIEDQVAREALVVKAKNLSVSDEEAKQFFESNKDKLGTPEAVRLRHILLADRKQAEDFLLAIKAGADFAKLAAQASLDEASRDRGGDIGFISRGMLQPEIEKEAFVLKPGEASLARSAQGYHLLRAEEFRPARPADFKQIKDGLKAAILADKISKAWPAYLQELRAQAKIEPASQARR